MELDPKLEGDLNEFYAQAEKGVGKLLEGASIDSAVIFNGTNEPVTFFVYNYIDTVYWVPAMEVKVAPGESGIVAASGKQFKVHPNKNKDNAFLVAPKTAWVYKGPGVVSQAK